MIRRKSWPLVLIATVIFAILLVVCGSIATAPAQQALFKLKVAHPHKGLPEISDAPIAGLKGFFKEEGLEVEFFWTKGGGDTVRAVTTGGVDIGLDVGPMAILGAMEQGAKLKIVSAGITGPNFIWMVFKDHPAKTIKDLEGKKIGYSSQGSSTHLVSMFILEQTGVKAEVVASGSTPDSWTAARTRQIDAAWTTPPDTYKIEKEGGRAVFASRDFPALRDYTFAVNFAMPDVIRNKHDAFVAFHRALNKASNFVARDPEGAAKIYQQNTNLSEELLVRYFKSIDPKTQWNPSIIKGWDITSKYAKIFKFVSKEIDLKDILDLSTLPK